jgi:hypothetical protein
VHWPVWLHAAPAFLVLKFNLATFVSFYEFSRMSLASKLARSMTTALDLVFYFISKSRKLIKIVFCCELSSFAKDF